MKKLLLIAFALPLIGFTQTVSTIASGDYYDTLVWDCNCIPSDGDVIYIYHDMTSDSSIHINGGYFYIYHEGSLIVNSANAEFTMSNGVGARNYGTFNTYKFTLFPECSMVNDSTMVCDSLLNQGWFTNNLSLTVNNFTNDEEGMSDTFGYNTGTMTITNNFRNQGSFMNENKIIVQNDFFNCSNTATGATFTNQVDVCVSNDFFNCSADELSGYGNYFIGNESTNEGTFTGAFSFHTPSGSLNVNNGTVEPTVTITSGSCSLGVAEQKNIQFAAYPNPTNGVLTINVENFSNAIDVNLLNHLGQIISSSSFNASHEINLNINGAPGMYFVQIKTKEGKTSIVRVIKK